HEFAEKYPENFFQFGITEHSTATCSGSLSAESAVSVWADFGMFGMVETYNQARLNDINHGNLKLFCTHCGIDVGEDGMTHQCIDYFALLNSTFGWKVITPADANQTDRIIRHVLTTPGNFAVIMGRSVTPIVTNENGQPYFGEDYVYRYGRMEQIRKGKGVALICSGNMLAVGLKTYELLKSAGQEISLISISDWSDIHQDDIASLAAYRDIVTLEDHNVKTGLGTTLGTMLFERGIQTRLTRIGVTRYGSSGKPAELYNLLGMDPESIAGRIWELSATK
ncbi:MAG TPA: transketolase C-terminal domain-containing protein, partial [candidate division Zixibacteria bacterium]|nr:transketolase C-terminal domain-containing protein [candidate division Zixibacteria bacterium]